MERVKRRGADKPAVGSAASLPGEADAAAKVSPGSHRLSKRLAISTNTLERSPQRLPPPCPPDPGLPAGRDSLPPFTDESQTFEHSGPSAARLLRFP